MQDANCRGCGSLLGAGPDEARRAIEELLDSTRSDNSALGRVCPLCGHATTEPVSHRKSVQFGLLIALLLIAGFLVIAYYTSRGTERRQVVHEALLQLQTNPDVIRQLGTPLTVRGEVLGQVTQDETGWSEARLAIPLRGPRATGVAKIAGGRESGPWKFTTFEVVIAEARKRIDLISGRVVDYDQEGYVDVHTQRALEATFLRTDVPRAMRGAEFPCIYATPELARVPRNGSCTPRLPVAALDSGPVDDFLLDLRYGKFVLRQTDLSIQDGDLRVPFTRTYASEFWVHYSRSNAFGVHSTHDFDVAPVGSRNPYTYLMIVLPDGDILHFPRISKGSGYADAVYQHSETASPFYGALLRWTGEGWATTLRDGSKVHFPESYNATNMAQGAPDELVDARGHKVALLRDRQRNLQMIETPQRRRITLTVDGRGRVVRAEGSEGQWVEYRYDPSGTLTEVSRADGRARRYTYDGALLTSVRDESGRALIANSYQKGRVIRQTYANGESCEIRYDIAPNGAYATRAVLTTPDGATHSIPTESFVPQWVRDAKPR
jgi:YD repeat-containing protein